MWKLRLANTWEKPGAIQLRELGRSGVRSSGRTRTRRRGLLDGNGSQPPPWTDPELGLEAWEVAKARSVSRILAPAGRPAQPFRTGRLLRPRERSTTQIAGVMVVSFVTVNEGANW
jgi:hypothetical protein